MSYWSLAYVVSQWAIRVIMLIVATRRRRPTSAMAWLLVIFFEPWVGLVLYLLIGNYRLPTRRSVKHARLLEELKETGPQFVGHPHVTRPQLAPELMSAVTLAERLGHMPILGGNHVELMTRNSVLFDRVVADIDRAERFVHLLYYIYGDDETGRRVADALARAVRRGVKCRVLLDAVGSRPMLKTLGAQMARQGIEVRAALPVGLIRRSVARVDLRNHRKILIVDGRAAYAGSHNCINASYGRKDMLWHDLSVRLTGPIVLELQAVFVGDWYFETDELLDGDEFFPTADLAGDIPAQALPSGPNYPTENYQRLLVAALHSAQRHVVMTTPYFVPDDAFMQTIQTITLRGVEVDLVVPRRSNMPLLDAASHAYYEELLECGVRLHLYTEGLLHAKTMTIDDEIAFVGSSNFDIRSFALNFEINLLFYAPQVVGQLRAQQSRYIETSTPLDLEQWRRRPAVRRVAQNIAKLLSPLL